MATTIFLCTNGKEEGVDPDMISFLNYVDGKPPEGAFTKAFAAAVEEIKEHTEMRREYMTLLMELEEKLDADLEARVAKERDHWMATAREEGRASEQMSAIQNLMSRAGWTLDQAMDMLGIPRAERPKYTALLNT